MISTTMKTVAIGAVVVAAVYAIPAQALTSTTTWQNQAFSSQAGTFTAQFDAVPNTANMDGVTALSSGAASAYTSCAAVVRFNSTGTIDVRNGGAYAAETTITYTAGTSYHFRLVVNVPSHTYSVYVTPYGGTEQTLGTNYAFRTEQATASSLANWGTISEVGAESVSGFTVAAQATPPLTASAGSAQTITAGQSCTFSGSASGGTNPYTYSWSPATGLSGATIASPTASPTATTTYTLTVTDATGTTASASVAVTVNPATGGPTYYVSPGGNDSNPGTAVAPWPTLAKAGSTAQAGSTVIVEAGTYNGGFTPTVSGTSSALITFQSQTPRGAAINGQVNLCGVDYVRIDGFSISNTATEGNGIQIQNFYDTGHGNGVQVANCYIHDGGGHAIAASNVTNLLVDNNEIYNNYHTGVIVSGASRNNQNVTIRGNYIHHNGQDGIHPEGSNILIEKNRIDDQYSTNQHQDGLEVYGPIDGLIIRNNIISDITQNIYISAENYPGSYIRNVEVLGNVSYTRNNPNLGKGIFVVGNTADVTNIRIEGNTFAYVAMNPITDSYASSSSCYISGLTLRNNIFYMCDVSVGVHSTPTMDYNLYYNPGGNDLLYYNGTYYNTLAAFRSSNPSLNQHGIQADPLFVNPATRDLHLTSGSPAVNTGISVADLTVDPDGTPRPASSPYDIGAYQLPYGSPIGPGTVPTVVFNAAPSYIYEGTTVTLTATASDPDAGQFLTAALSQTAGQTATCRTASTPGSPLPVTWTFPFTAPTLTATANETLTFSLTATDNGSPGMTSPAVTVTIQEYVVGDISHDNAVNVADLQLLVAAWNSTSTSGNWNQAADLNSDGYVNIGDLQLLVANWGKSLH